MTFNSFIPLWLAVIVFVPLCALLIWKEWTKKYRFRLLRVLAVCLMIFALAGILLHPQYNEERSGSVLVLTPGYDLIKTDSLIRAHPELILMHAPGVAPYKKSKAIESYYDLAAHQNNIKFVSGHGLPIYALDLMDNKNFSLVPAQPKDGITDLSIPRRILANREYSITGTNNNNNNARATWIHLIGPGGIEDSVKINERKKAFTLSFTPRKAGNLLYSISITDSLGHRRMEDLPLHVDQADPIKILAILSYPTFESTYLKNFITRKGNSLVLRSQLSKNNFGYEYANHTPLQFSKLTTNLLHEFDLLIADQATLRKLSSDEISTLKKSIQSGLGLLPLFSTLPKEKTDSHFFPLKVTSVKVDTTEISIGSKRLTLPALPFRAVRIAGLQPLEVNMGGILSGYTLEREGKIGFQFLQETYRLGLSGDSVAYSNLWSPLIEKIARTRHEDSSLKIANPFPIYMDEPFQVDVISTQNDPALFCDSIRVPLREDVQLDDVWHATLWGGVPGWHSLQIDKNKLDYYVSKREEWKTLSIQRQMQGNLANNTSSTGTESKTTEELEVPPSFFFITFLIAAGFVWLAPKL